MRTAVAVLVMAVALAAIPGGDAFAADKHYAAFVVRGHACWVRVYGARHPPPSDVPALFERFMKPGEQVVLPLPSSGLWVQHTQANWDGVWTSLAWIGHHPRYRRIYGQDPPEVLWVDVEN